MTAPTRRDSRAVTLAADLHRLALRLDSLNREAGIDAMTRNAIERIAVEARSLALGVEGWITPGGEEES